MTLAAAVLLAAEAGPAGGQTEDTLPVGAVRERSVKASPSPASVRPVGELRIWSFFSQGNRFGQLSSMVKEGREFDGRRGITLQERLDLNYSLVGGDRHERVNAQTHLSSWGAYLGSQFEIGPEDSLETLELRRDGDKIAGYFTRAGSRNDVSLVADRDMAVWDPNFVDQIELLLALKDLNIGTAISDSVVSPQSLIKSVVSGRVIYFMWQEIYKGRIDSVFIIRLDRPFEGQLYFTPDKRLVRTDFINQKVRVYQDLVQPPVVQPSRVDEPRGQQQNPSFTWRTLVFKLPYYAAFLLAALVAMVMFSREAFRLAPAYFFAVIGSLLYVLIPQVQNPIIIRIVAWLLPEGGVSGFAAYRLALVAPVLGGLFQSALMLGALFGLFSIMKIKPEHRVGLAVFLAGGFAVAEACYMSGLAISPLFGWDGLGQLMMVLFHVATGALIGGAMGLGPKHLIPAVLVAALVNAALRYLPFFPQLKVLDTAVVHMMMAVIALSFIAAVLLLLRRLRV